MKMENSREYEKMNISNIITRKHIYKYTNLKALKGINKLKRKANKPHC